MVLAGLLAGDLHFCDAVIVVHRVDWFRILIDLERAGLTQQEVADVTGIPRSTLKAYKDATEPSYFNGEVLISCWMRYTGRHRNDVPMG